MFFDLTYIEKITKPEILGTPVRPDGEMTFKQAATYFERCGLRYELEERAAILEYDGGLTREEADRRAIKEILERTKGFGWEQE